jgi:hypothetical protein
MAKEESSDMMLSYKPLWEDPLFRVVSKQSMSSSPYGLETVVDRLTERVLSRFEPAFCTF